VSDGLLLALRTSLSLTVVLLVVWGAARLLGRMQGHHGGGVLEVLARQPVGRTASVAVVRVADRAYVLGVTEQSITLLEETGLDDLQDAESARPLPPRVRRTPLDRSPGPTSVSVPDGHATSAGTLHGSVLAPSTWRQAVEVVRERTVRR
jgi:flagellar protein FliO/FliZ